MSELKPDHAAFNAEVLSAPFMVALMKKTAEKAKAIAEEIAPVGKPSEDKHSGRYKASFTAEADIRATNGPRARGTLRNSAPEAMWVEIGTKNNPAYHVLKKAMLAAGP